MEKGSISIHFVHAALSAVQARGLDNHALLLEAGIAPSLLQSTQARVTATHYGRLWLAVARLLDDEFFGQDAHGMKVGSFAMLCRTLIHCKTLKSAVVRMQQFFNLVLDDYHCAVICEDTLTRIEIQERRSDLIIPPRPFGHETLMIMQHGIACWLVGRRIPVLKAGFAYPKPSQSAEYRVMYSSQLGFDEPVSSLTFNSDYLDLPIIQSEKTLKKFLQGAPANFVVKYKNNQSISAQIRKKLRATARDEWDHFDQFALHMNMTRSTLRRRLSDEGLSFQSIKDQLRRDIAIDYLSHSSMSVMEISSELGFAEPSAFHRAFKKWTGASPGQYRERLHEIQS
ncbi:AraC family transcriptional regulator [Aquirhabdus sp.]|uniref:AraC family transcriptional regulator n=1 Tax=Aquirhabdus sp. TaxID=2824160 RepID=UPI00396C9E90